MASQKNKFSKHKICFRNADFGIQNSEFGILDFGIRNSEFGIDNSYRSTKMNHLGHRGYGLYISSNLVKNPIFTLYIDFKYA